MRWRRAAAVLAGTALAGTTGIAVMAGGAAASQVTASMAGAQSAVAAQVSPAAGHWGHAHQVDLSALQPGNGAIGIDALSCASPGNCSAGGHYTDSAQHRQVFVVTEDGGTWGEPVELTSGGIPDFSSGEPLITSLTCPVADNCAVGGFYHDAAGNERPWISASINDVWDSVETIGFAGNIIPGGLKSRITSMSLCAPIAECAIGLTAPIGTSNEALVTTSLNAPAQLVPGIQQLNTGRAAEVDSVSCWSFGNCLAGGFYTDADHHAQPFIASDINSTWGQGTEVPGLDNADPVATAASVLSVSCPAAGDCSTGGFYTDENQHEQAFVFSQANGTWLTPQPIPGVASLNTGGRAHVIGVSCGAPGDCAAAGQYVGDSGTQGFVLSEAGFTWSTSPVVGLFPAQYAYTQVSCPAAGTCVAGGSFADASGHQRPFVQPETAGVWGSAHQLAGNLNTGDGELTSLSCPQPGSCAAGGSYTDARGNLQAFVADASPATSTSLSPAAAEVTYGHEQSAKFSVTVTPEAGGIPTGKVTVKTGSASLCTITPGGGTGGCALAATKLRPGTYQLTASYGGDTVYNGSTSAQHALTVAAEPTSTGLSLSTGTVTFGHEQSEHLTVTVKPAFGGTAAGQVTITTGSTGICTITLVNGRGSCTMSASKLRPGKYTLTAAYTATSRYAASISPRKTLTVTKASHTLSGARGTATAAVSGTLRAWGLGGNGQLGNGSTQTSTVPVKVALPAGTKVTSVRAGCFHTLALTSTGQVLAWGSNQLGQLGDGTTQFRAKPVKVHIPAGTTIKAIRAGCFHSLALTSTGQVLAWGSNANGQLGNGTTTDSHTPTLVSLPTGTTVKAISAGRAHSLALTSARQVLAWGFNAVGQLGNGTTHDSDAPVPVTLPTGTTVAGIAAGDLHSLALTSTGQVLAWGFGLQGELGNGTFNSSDTPVMVMLPQGTTVRQLSAGCEHTLALTSTGQVLAWGFNADGELGNDSTQESDVPVMAGLPQDTMATEVSAGCNHSLALTSSGHVLAWGRNDDGELGNASTVSSDVPVQVNLPATVTPVATGAGPAGSVSFAIVHKAAT